MKYPCNMIRDLLPLYHDQVASEESITAVRQHLKECEECREYYDRMCGSDDIEKDAYDRQLALKAADSYRKVHKKILKKTGGIIGVTVLATASLIFAVYAAIVGYLTVSASASKEIYRDISEYSVYRSGENALDNFRARGMDEIWPEEITGGMNARDYLMVSYNPWDANYLGYLVTEYADSAEYEAEVLRLSGYASTEYIGNYGATGFEHYDVLAMNAGDDGFVYAITDGSGVIVYVEMIFPGYGMDIPYEKYIPAQYLPKGLDATKDNPVRQKVVEELEKSRTAF